MKKKGAGALAQNQKNAERLPAALKSVKAGKDTVTAIFDYASFEDLKAFERRMTTRTPATP